MKGNSLKIYNFTRVVNIDVISYETRFRNWWIHLTLITQKAFSHIMFFPSRKHSRDESYVKYSTVFP